MTLRNRHHRVHDHDDAPTLSKIVLEATIPAIVAGKPTYPEGMLVADVLADFVSRLEALGLPRFVTADAVIMRTQQRLQSYRGSQLYAFWADAVITS